MLKGNRSVFCYAHAPARRFNARFFPSGAQLRAKCKTSCLRTRKQGHYECCTGRPDQKRAPGCYGILSNSLCVDLRSARKGCIICAHRRAHARSLLRVSYSRVAVDLPNATIDVPLDPEEQAEYRANREIVEDHAAYEKMKEDAIARRTFSNLVAEFTLSFDEEHPLKIIGGQHRFSAIQEALAAGIDEYHGLKIYFDLDADQRLDVQLISNTNIAVSTDLFDRMQETLTGPKLRDWCQAVGFLDAGQDFADKRDRARPVTVRAVRTFITSYYRGRSTKPDKFGPGAHDAVHDQQDGS